MEYVNIINLDKNKSHIDDDKLIVDNKKYSLDDLITIYKTEEQYEDENSELKFAQTHFGDKLAYIEDIHVLITGGDIDNLNDQLSDSDDIDIDSFEEFIKELSKIAVNPFKVATVSWEESGIGVYYMKFNKDFKSIRLDFDDWEETELFKEIAKENDFDIDGDDFYDDDDDHEEGRSPCYQVCDQLYDQLLSDPELLKPDWY